MSALVPENDNISNIGHSITKPGKTIKYDAQLRNQVIWINRLGLRFMVNIRQINTRESKPHM